MLALVLANAGYFAWTQGLLALYGFAPSVQSEPQRLEQQLRPEAMRLLSPAEIRLQENIAAVAGTAPGECLQAGVFTEAQASILRTRLESVLPAGSWLLEAGVEPSRWIVYMGRYANEEALAKKRGELRGLGVGFEPLINPALAPGLSLGHFNSQLEAERELVRVANRGVQTARVLQEPETQGQRLRLPVVNPLMKSQLDLLKPQLAGKTLQACR